MGIFGSIGKGLKKVGKVGGKVLGGVGDVVRKAAPLVGLIPGVGTVAGGIIGGAGGLLGNLNDEKVSLGSVLGNTLKGGAGGAIGGLANASLLGGKGILGVTGALGKAKGLLTGGPARGGEQIASGDQARRVHELVAAGKISPASAAKIIASPNFGRPTGGAGGGMGGGILDSVKSFITKRPADVLGLGLGAANIIGAGKQSGKADAARKVALARLTEREPIDLSAEFGNTGNPYAQQGPGTSRRTALRALQGAY